MSKQKNDSGFHPSLFLFDLGDIFFEAHFWRKWLYNEFINQINYSGSFKDFYNLYETYLQTTYEAQTSYRDQFINFINDHNITNPKQFMKEAFSKKIYFEDTRVLYPEVLETLTLLKNKDKKLIILTDNESSSLTIRKTILERFQLNHLIDEVITSFDIGVTKPHPLFFNEGINAAKVTIEETVFVAHDKDEIDGAKDLGLTVIEFNNYLKVATHADYKIKSFSELLKWN